MMMKILYMIWLRMLTMIVITKDFDSEEEDATDNLRRFLNIKTF